MNFGASSLDGEAFWKLHHLKEGLGLQEFRVFREFRGLELGLRVYRVLGKFWQIQDKNPSQVGQMKALRVEGVMF